MIDPSTYTQLHSDGDTSADSLSSKDDLGGDAMASDRPPGGNFLLLSPPTIYGYDMNEHRWRKLLVSNTGPVIWNKRSFEHLILNDGKKDLLTATITPMVASGNVDKSTGGKSDGLILLFHGGPGSGKTFAAEAIAESTERPLYRINCGNIGTDVENVERCFNSILHIRTTWGCVVLLDDADVVFAKRHMTDMQRDALISVFLRFFDHYQGILILISNRLSTFDKGFKSRIQFALHFDALTPNNREKIWCNYIRSLHETNVIAEFDNLLDDTTEFAKYELNGRQIRNVVKMAVQSANFKGETLKFSHFETLMNATQEFDQFVENLNRYIDSQRARKDGIR
jgi:SpoVK/Ycf46/Vps4 family AAA+-type ATPase